jgi:hypothetical protein
MTNGNSEAVFIFWKTILASIIFYISEEMRLDGLYQLGDGTMMLSPCCMVAST